MESEKKTRLRAPNFTASENRHLCEVLEKYKQKIENKKTDGASLQDKQKAWLLVARDYNSTTTSYTRTLESLQQSYKNMKKKVKKQLSSSKMSIPVNRELLLERVKLHGDDQKESESVGVSQDSCQEEFEVMQMAAKRLANNIKKEISATGGGPSSQPTEHPLLDKVCSLVGPTMNGKYTNYDGDSSLMEYQGISPVEAIYSEEESQEEHNKEETPSFFNNSTNNRANLKRKPHPSLSCTITKKIKENTANETVSGRSLAKRKMELVSLRKEVLIKQLKTEDEKFANAQLENEILKLRLLEQEENLAHARLLRSAELEQINKN